MKHLIRQIIKYFRKDIVDQLIHDCVGCGRLMKASDNNYIYCAICRDVPFYITNPSKM